MYTGLKRHVCIGEVLRNAAGDRVRQFRYTEWRVRRAADLDCREVSQFALPYDAFIDDSDFDVPHAVAAAALRHRTEALLVRSALHLNASLVVFLDLIQHDSFVAGVQFVDPRLVKHR